MTKVSSLEAIFCTLRSPWHQINGTDIDVITQSLATQWCLLYKNH
ncbi:hypothetical protein [Nostoc sp.]